MPAAVAKGAIMFCRACGAELAEDSVYCAMCGTKCADPRPAESTQPVHDAPMPSEPQPPYNAQAPRPGQPQPPQSDQPQDSRKGPNVVAIVGFVFAVIGLILFWVPILGWAIWFVGAILSLIGITKRPRALAIAGTIISFIDVILLLVFILGGCAAIGTGGCTMAGLNAGTQPYVSTRASNSSSMTGDEVITLTAYTIGGERLSGTVRRDANDYVLPYSSTREYTRSELQAMGLTPAELCIAWNEPFAREGYHFKNEDLQDYFEGTSWYRDRNAQVNLTGAAAANNELLRELADTTGDGSKWKDLAAGN